MHLLRPRNAEGAASGINLIHRPAQRRPAQSAYGPYSRPRLVALATASRRPWTWSLL